MGLADKTVFPTLAVTDIARARDFYGKTLELEEVSAFMPEDTDALFRVGAGYLYLYERATPSGSSATACSFAVDDVERAVRELRQKGVVFQEYDDPEAGLRTVDGIAELAGVKSAWFVDPSGNILAVGDALAVLARRRREGRGAPAGEGLHA